MHDRSRRNGRKEEGEAQIIPRTTLVAYSVALYIVIEDQRSVYQSIEIFCDIWVRANL